ncbi:hypothetical protein [Tardiphaga sp.]|uniref:hypothetical protein n=1 Tax=Tardiphaga sp. TaxID=1926292 RepID=UPI0025F48526|nr:hypothetical protein [Tardiphaga sp.]
MIPLALSAVCVNLLQLVNVTGVSLTPKGPHMARFTLLAPLTLLGCTAIGALVPAHAEQVSSAYTSAAGKDCRTLSGREVDTDDEASEQLCRGPAGLVVLKNETDLRETVTVGRNAEEAGRQLAAAQGFGPFNSTTDTIEWRLGGNGKPFAMIQRWHIADNGDLDAKGRPRNEQMLVVTRLPPGAACHVAYIDVKANADANALARKAADQLARGFDCGNDKVAIICHSGRAVELAKR